MIAAMQADSDIKLAAKRISQHTPEDEIAGLVDAIRQTPGHRVLLVDLLPEKLPLYAGRSTNEVIRIRGYLLAAFEQVGLPELAIPFVLEELESGRDAYLVAGAAKAVRGLAHPTPEVVPYLLKAVQNIKYMDDALTFEQYKAQWPLTNYTSALKEIFTTFGWLGAYARQAVEELEALYTDRFGDFSSSVKAEIRQAIEAILSDERKPEADCCTFSLRDALNLNQAVPKAISGSEIEALVLEDQEGSRVTFGQFFRQKPCVLAFFYTRCENPEKCSLTITKLGHLQKALEEQGLEHQVKVAAITYDPEYDLPARMKGYGQNRGFRLDEDNRLLRVEAGFKGLQQYLELGVNFIGTLVNKHRIELFILDENGNVACAFTRLQWEVEEVLAQAKQLIENKREEQQPEAAKRQKLHEMGKAAIGNLQSVVPPLLIAFFPKCPMCWAAYLSIFGVAGIQAIPYTPELLVVLGAVMVANLWWFYRTAAKRNGLVPFYFSCLGTVCMLAGLQVNVQTLLFAGIGLITTGVVLNNLSYGAYLKLKYLVYSRLSKVRNALSFK